MENKGTPENKNVDSTEKVSLMESSPPTLSPWEKFLQEVNPNHKAFFVKVGDPYDGISFTLDPHIYQFEDADRLEHLLYTEDDVSKVDLSKLRDLLQKCKDVKHLKFYGIEVDYNLVEVIATHCPKLVNLEINPHHEGWGSDEPEMDFVPEIDLLLTRCTNVATIIIRQASKRVVEFIQAHGFDWDEIGNNYCFNHFARSTYQMNPSLKHHNVAGLETGVTGVVVGTQFSFLRRVYKVYQGKYEIND